MKNFHVLFPKDIRMETIYSGYVYCMGNIFIVSENPVLLTIFSRSYSFHYKGDVKR